MVLHDLHRRLTRFRVILNLLTDHSSPLRRNGSEQLGPNIEWRNDQFSNSPS